MSKLVCAVILTAVTVLALGCGAQISKVPTSSNKQAQNEGSKGKQGEKEDQQTQPGDGNGDSEDLAKLCYSQGEVESCYRLFELAEVNQAENMYNYIGPGDPGFPSGFNPVHYRKPQRLYFVPELPGSTQISDNFQRRDVIWANPRRGHYGHFSPLVVSKLQALREQFAKPLIVNSGYRSPGYNATLDGAARFSRHTYGDAVDFKIPGVGFQQIAQACRQLGAAFTQIYRSHIHCDWRTSPLDENTFGQAPNGEVTLAAAAHVQRALHSHSQIHAEQIGSMSSTKIKVQFHVETITEDEGELALDWQFHKDGKLLNSSDSPSPRLTLDKGRYQGLVNVGGSFDLSEDLVLD
jgi:hypothetical protein